jgi:predicted TIM-barrel fold metal-dependent hydrolase
VNPSLITRRNLLAAGLTTTAAGLLGAHVRSAPQDDVRLPIIDTHTHFYDPTRPEGVPWPPRENKLLYRRVLSDDYRRLAEPLGIVGTVVVEASPWVEDNQWVLDLTEKEPFLVGLVGHLVPGTEDFAKHLERFAANPKFRGIRVGAAALREGLDRPEFIADLKRLQDRELILDVNGSPELLPLVDRLAAKLPDLPIVINHVANVRNRGRDLDPDWLTGLRAAARHSHVSCKVSALTEGAARDGESAPTDPEFYVPLLDAVWDAFGEDRLLFGSNWPVCERAGTLDTVVRIVTAYFAGRGRAVQEKFFAGNARRVYRWPSA